ELDRLEDLGDPALAYAAGEEVALERDRVRALERVRGRLAVGRRGVAEAVGAVKGADLELVAIGERVLLHGAAADDRPVRRPLVADDRPVVLPADLGVEARDAARGDRERAGRLPAEREGLPRLELERRGACAEEDVLPGRRRRRRSGRRLAR